MLGRQIGLFRCHSGFLRHIIHPSNSMLPQNKFLQDRIAFDELTRKFSVLIHLDPPRPIIMKTPSLRILPVEMSLEILCVDPEPITQHPRAQASTTSSSRKQQQITLTSQAEPLSFDASSLSGIRTLSNLLESLQAEKLVQIRYCVQEFKDLKPLQAPRCPVQGVLRGCLEEFRKDMCISEDYKKFFLHVQCRMGCIRLTVEGKTVEQSERSFCNARKHCLQHICESFEGFKEERYRGTMSVFIKVEPYEGVSTGRANFCNFIQW